LERLQSCRSLHQLAKQGIGYPVLRHETILTHWFAICCSLLWRSLLNYSRY